MQLTNKRKSDYTITGWELIPAVAWGTLGASVGIIGSVVIILGVGTIVDLDSAIAIAILSVSSVPEFTAWGITTRDYSLSDSNKKKKYLGTLIGSWIGLATGGVVYILLFPGGEDYIAYTAIAGCVLGGICGYNLTKINMDSSLINIKGNSVVLSFPQIYFARSYFNPEDITINTRLLQIKF